ncbi:hypothetical protein AtEden1_Chr1g0055621 [Arabidopsis thaliana]
MYSNFVYSNPVNLTAYKTPHNFNCCGGKNQGYKKLLSFMGQIYPK